MQQKTCCILFIRICGDGSPDKQNGTSLFKTEVIPSTTNQDKFRKIQVMVYIPSLLKLAKSFNFGYRFGIRPSSYNR